MTSHRTPRHSHQSELRRAAVIAGCVGILAVLGGCSGNDDKKADDEKKTVPRSEATKGPKSTQVFPDMGDDFAGIVKDVKAKSCTLKKGKASATGQVTNSSKESRDLLVGVIWLKEGGKNTVDLKAWTGKNVPAGKTVTWKVETTLPDVAEECVYQGKSNKAGTLK